MPEIVVIWLVGAIFSFVLVNLHFYFVHRSFQDSQVKILRHNLSKINLYWSTEKEDLVAIVDGQSPEPVAAQDYRNSMRAAFIFGTLLIPLSWLGVLILGIFVISIHRIAVSRLKHNIFQSVLIEKDLPAEEVETVLQPLIEIAGKSR